MWWKRVPDGWGCNVETPSAELCSCQRDKTRPTGSVGDWNADIVVTDTENKK